MASDPTTTITITSDSAHPFSAFLLLPFVNVAYTAAFLINIALFLYALNLLIAFLVDGRGRLRRMPVLAGIVLVVQIVASAVRAMNFYDNAFAKGQTFPYFWWRTGQTVYIGLHYLTTATLAIVMYQTYMASRTGAKMGNCRKYAFSICIISIYAASGYDFVSTIISAYTEIEDRTMAAGEVLYIVLALPILITFIVYGSRVSALLTSNASKFGQDALMKRRLRFARRTLASGVVGIAMTAIIIVDAFVYILYPSANLIGSYSTCIGFNLMTLDDFLYVAAFNAPQNDSLNMVDVIWRHCRHCCGSPNLRAVVPVTSSPNPQKA